MIAFPQIGYMGRLGNQMFQFASTLGIASRLNTIARFPIENCFNYQESGPFDPAIGRCMSVKCDLIDCFEISPEYFIPQRHIHQGYYYHETEFGYNPGVESIYDDCLLNGYFQTEKYFSEFRELILSQLTFKSPYRELASEYIENIRRDKKSSVLVSIHVRRGDYVMFPDHHPVCSKEYYSSAIEEMKKLDSEAIFIVFSDDVEWCKKEFAGENYIVNEIGNPYAEMCAMSLCDHNIMANSSFSWWGSWLNRNPNKKVIAPSRWFGNLIKKDTSDVYFENVKII
jgi:hypothetical protein